MSFKRQSTKQKMVGTVNLLKQSLLAISGIAVAGVIVAFFFDYAIGLIITGVALFAVGGSIVSFRRLIWDSYQQTSKQSKSKSFWVKPSRFSYWFNVWFIMPCLMLLGMLLILNGVFAGL